VSKRERQRIRTAHWATVPGAGYLAAYKALGVWHPAGMKVYETRGEALAFARKHHPKASDHDGVPFRPWGTAKAPARPIKPVDFGDTVVDLADMECAACGISEHRWQEGWCCTSCGMFWGSDV
jgi:hypothetical protein